MDDPVQGDQPQGGEATETPLESFLSTVPEAQREYVEPYLKEAEKNVNGRLQAAAELQKTWEPYKDTLDPQLYPPEQLSELLAWHQQVTSSDEAYQEWLGNAAKEAGLTPKEEEVLEDVVEQGDLTPDEVKKVAEQIAEERLGPLNERLTNFETEQAVNAEEGKIRSRIDELQKESGVQLTEAQKAVVFDLGANDPDDDWVKVGFDRFREIYAEGQKAFVNDKVDAPATPVTGGGREQFKPTTSYAEAEKQARERLRQAQS